MIVIKFSVYNQRLRRITSGIIPSNAYGKLKFEFDFRTEIAPGNKHRISPLWIIVSKLYHKCLLMSMLF